MAKNQGIAVDIGTNSVKVLQLGLTRTGLMILNAGVRNYPRQTAAERITDEAVIDALSQLIRDRGFRMRHVAMSLPRHLVTVRGISGLPVSATEEDIDKMVPMQLETELPFEIPEAIYSIYNLQRLPDNTSLEVVAARKSAIERYTSIAEEVGLKLEAIIPSAFATYALVFDQFKDQLVGKNLAIADIGAGGTDICIIQHGRLSFSRSFTFGGNNLTQLFEREYKLSFDDAEEKKIEEASLRSQAEDALTRQWVESLVREIAASIRAFTGKETNGSIDSLWLCGGSSLIPGLDSYLTDRLGIQVSLWNPLQGVESHFLREETAAFGSGLSVDLGLGIIAIAGKERAATVNANLLPKEIMERAQRTRQKILFSVIAVLAVLIISGSGWGFNNWRQHRLALYNSVSTKLKSLEQEVATKHAKEALTNSVLMEQMMTPYITPLEILRNMSEKLPDRKRVSLTSLAIDRSGKITMGVEASSYADVGEAIQVLSDARISDKAPLFSEVKHGAISKVTKEKQQIFQVQIICVLNKEAVQEM